MIFQEIPGIKPAKIEEIRARFARLKIDISLIEESFSRGSGKGGQKINKTSNCVHLKYPPMGIVVRCRRERQRSVNRFLALRELADKIEMQISPQTSARLAEVRKIQKRKARKKRKYNDKPDKN